MGNQKGYKTNDKVPEMERIFFDKAEGAFKMVVVKPAVVTYSREGEYSGRGKRGTCVTIKAASKSQVRKYCRQNGFKPQAYEGSKGDWTADCRRPLPKDGQGAERDEGVRVSR